ncbi:MAG: hypothetical protein WC773_03090 [Patescibacteria group bacterium]|jgi:chromosome segregation ATPase
MPTDDSPEARIESQRTYIQQLEREKAQLSQELADVRQEIQTTRNSLREAQETLAGVAPEKLELLGQLRTEQTRNRQLEDRLGLLRSVSDQLSALSAEYPPIE